MYIKDDSIHINNDRLNYSTGSISCRMYACINVSCLPYSAFVRRFDFSIVV